MGLDESVWSNLIHHRPSHAKTGVPFLAVLKKLSIAIPNQMIVEIMQDSTGNTGNREVTHSVDNGIYKRGRQQYFVRLESHKRFFSASLKVCWYLSKKPQKAKANA